MRPSENYYLKTISHYNQNFDRIDTVEGRVASESAVPSVTPVRTYYDDSGNPNAVTRILDQRNVTTQFTYINPDGK
ncbi:MAG: hypothetical protein HY801_03335, partial [Candidatus Lindowbacteria bacterium]|nr:hypothetical protein [Candidatus Lindowbacteria bacterium]